MKKKIIGMILMLSIIVCAIVPTTAFAFSKTLPNGLYKVGTDIPVGVYSLEPINGNKNLYYEVEKDTSNRLSGVKYSGKFDGQLTLILKDGEYLRIMEGPRTIQ